MRRAAKRDTSEGPIVQYLRKAGWSVLAISVKDGPDLVAGKFGQNLLLECKTGTRKLRPSQVQWGQDWQGDPPYVIRTVDEAMALNRAVASLAKLRG